MEWYKKAADQGHTGAQAFLAKLYSGGYGVEQDHSKALKLFRKVAEAGDSYAAKLLGDIYTEGKIVEKDDKLAMEWYRIAASSGNKDAEMELTYLQLQNGEERNSYPDFFRNKVQ